MNTLDKAFAHSSAGEWELFAHDADVGVRGYGQQVSEAFANAALAMTATILDPAAVACRETIHVRCQAPNMEILFVDWLNALVFEMSTRGMVFGTFKVSVRNGELVGEAVGEPVKVKKHAPAVEVKGATLTELRVEKGHDGRWIAQCVIDV